MGISIQKLLLVLAIVAVIFGTGRLKSIAADMGSALRSFRKAVNNEEASPTDAEHREPERLTQGTQGS